MDAIAPEFEKFATKHQLYVEDSNTKIDEIIQLLKDTREKLISKGNQPPLGCFLVPYFPKK
jgi:hypothetical protein